MVPLQNRRNLRVLLVAIFIFMFCSCSTLQEDENFIKLQKIIPKSNLDTIENVIVIFSFRCVGCVEDKLKEMNEVLDEKRINKTLIVYDSSYKEIHSILKSYNNKIHIPYREVDEVYPEMANLCVFKKKSSSIVFKIVNANDSSIVYYLNSL